MKAKKEAGCRRLKNGACLCRTKGGRPKFRAKSRCK